MDPNKDFSPEDVDVVRRVWGSLEPDMPMTPPTPQPYFKEYTAYEDCGDPISHVALKDIKSILDPIY